MIALAQGENAHTRARAPHDPTPPTRPGVLQVATPARPKEQGALWLPPCFFFCSLCLVLPVLRSWARAAVCARAAGWSWRPFGHMKTALNPNGPTIALSGVLGWYTTAMARPARR